MDPAPYVVGVVLDIAFGVRLSELARRMPVWIVDTPINRAAAEELWRRDPIPAPTRKVSRRSQPTPNRSRKNGFWELETVDLHHGIHSHTPPYSALVVIGVHLTPQLRAAFEDFGLTLFEENSEGFTARFPTRD
jgi:hypothetical protein